MYEALLSTNVPPKNKTTVRVSCLLHSSASSAFLLPYASLFLLSIARVVSPVTAPTIIPAQVIQVVYTKPVNQPTLGTTKTIKHRQEFAVTTPKSITRCWYAGEISYMLASTIPSPVIHNMVTDMPAASCRPISRCAAVLSEHNGVIWAWKLWSADASLSMLSWIAWMSCGDASEAEEREILDGGT